jgi:hypothetical protein
MADITVTTDFTQVNNLKEALQTTGTAYVRIVDGIVRENNRLKSLLKKAAKDTEETNKIKEQADAIYTAKLQQEADKREKVRAREAAKAEKEAQRVEAANQKVIASEVKLRAELEKKAAKSAQSFQAQIGGNLGLGAQGISAGASASAMEGEIERLRLKYDQIYASSQLYEKSLLELNQAHMLGVTSAKQHEAAVESLNLEYQNFQNGVAQAGNRFATHVNQTSTGLNKFGVVAQQTGYQVSDFLVQVQGGTNPLVAFSQQATQLAGLLYLLPQRFLAAKVGLMGFTIGMSAIAAGITIGIPLLAMLAMNFLSSGKAAEEGAKGIDTQKQAFDALTESIRQLRLERQMAGTGLDETQQNATNELTRLQAEYNVLLAEQKELSDAAQASAADFQTQQQITNDAAIAAVKAEIAEAERKLRILAEEQRLAAEAVTYQQQLETAARRRANEERNAYREAKAEADRWKASLEGIKSVLDTINGMALNVTLNVQENMSDYAKSVFDRFKEISAIGPLWNNPAAATRPRRAPALLDENLIDTPRSGGGGAARIKKETEAVKELTAAEKERQTILQSIEGSLENGFMAMVDGTKSVKDAFRSMARDIIKELYNVLVVQRLVGSFDVAKGTGSGLVGFLGKAFTGQLATGGSVMPGKSYLVGENGPELVIPRHSGTVVNANQTANAAGGSGGITVQNNISVTGSDAAMVRAEVAKMIPQITNATKAAVIDARLRGGQMKSAFR